MRGGGVEGVAAAVAVQLLIYSNWMREELAALRLWSFNGQNGIEVDNLDTRMNECITVPNKVKLS